MGQFLRDVMRLNAEARNFRIMGPDETASNRLDAVFEVTERVWMERIEPYDVHLAQDGRVMEVLSEHLCQGWLEGISAHRTARLLLLLRGLHPHRGFHVQPARQMAEGFARPALATADRLAQLSADLACLAAGPQRLQPSGSRLRRSRRQQEGRHRPRLLSAGRQHAALDHRPLPADLRPHQRDRRRQAALAAMADHATGRHPLRRRHRNLGLGRHRNRTAPSRTS